MTFNLSSPIISDFKTESPNHFVGENGKSFDSNQQTALQESWISQNNSGSFFRLNRTIKSTIASLSPKSSTPDLLDSSNLHYISQKMNKVRWINTTGIGRDTENFLVSGSWDDQINCVTLWKIFKEEKNREVQVPLESSSQISRGSVTQLKCIHFFRALSNHNNDNLWLRDFVQNNRTNKDDGREQYGRR